MKETEAFTYFTHIMYVQGFSKKSKFYKNYIRKMDSYRPECYDVAFDDKTDFSILLDKFRNIEFDYYTTEVFKLYYIDDYSMDDIVDYFGGMVPRSQINKTIQFVRCKLQ
jgi:hypothetical protein